MPVKYIAEIENVREICLVGSAKRMLADSSEPIAARAH
jgi:hypothetical protein